MQAKKMKILKKIKEFFHTTSEDNICVIMPNGKCVSKWEYDILTTITYNKKTMRLIKNFVFNRKLHRAIKRAYYKKTEQEKNLRVQVELTTENIATIPYIMKRLRF